MKKKMKEKSSLWRGDTWWRASGWEDALLALEGHDEFMKRILKKPHIPSLSSINLFRNLGLPLQSILSSLFILFLVTLLHSLRTDNIYTYIHIYIYAFIFAISSYIMLLQQLKLCRKMSNIYMYILRKYK